MLLRVAKDAGFDVDDVREYINNESNLKSVTDKALSWKSKGVKGNLVSEMKYVTRIIFRWRLP